MATNIEKDVQHQCPCPVVEESSSSLQPPTITKVSLLDSSDNDKHCCSGVQVKIPKTNKDNDPHPSPGFDTNTPINVNLTEKQPQDSTELLHIKAVVENLDLQHGNVKNDGEKSYHTTTEEDDPLNYNDENVIHVTKLDKKGSINEIPCLENFSSITKEAKKGDIDEVITFPTTSEDVDVDQGVLNLTSTANKSHENDSGKNIVTSMTSRTPLEAGVEASNSSKEMPIEFGIKPMNLRQQNAEKLLFQFSKTFVSVMESTVFSKSDSNSLSDDDGDEADEYFDDFERYSSYSSCLLDSQLQPLSDEEFAFEKYFPPEHKEYFRNLFISVAFDLFVSYEYQLIMLVRERRKISEIAEDIVHRILDNFKESQRGFNPDYIRPEITLEFLIEKALQHSEPEGIIYNSEWSAVEILENPGILVKEENPASSSTSSSTSSTTYPGIFYQSHWQKNFIGVKKKIGSKYGFRLRLDFETEEVILQNFEKVPYSSVSPLYLQYQYCLNDEILQRKRKDLNKELFIEDKMKRFGITGEEKLQKDKVKDFQMKLQIQKLEEDRNSDKVMKQVVNLSHRFESLKSKIERLEEKGFIKGERAKIGLLRSNYNVRFEVKDPDTAAGDVRK